MTAPTDPEVTSKIIQALATYLKRDPATITESHHLRDDLGLDSVAIIELLFEIEERFKLQIPDQDLPGLSTVGTVAAYVQRRLVEAKADSKLDADHATAGSTKSASKKSTAPKTTPAKSPAKKSATAKSNTRKPVPLKTAAAKKVKKISSSPASRTKKKVTAR